MIALINSFFRFLGLATFSIVLLLMAGANSARADIPSWFWNAFLDWYNELNARMDTVEANSATASADVAALQTQVAAMDAYLQELQTYIAVDDTTDPTRPVVIVSGANLQIVNGLGSTPTVNGVGNLLLGYDENMTGMCTIVEDGPEIYDATTCGNLGGIFLPTSAIKTGSHNLVVGDRHTYTSYSGIVGGTGNYINGKGASITGGHYHTANGDWSHISGGELNIVYASRGSITGGASNQIEVGARSASISGGTDNEIETGALSASISGGSANTIQGGGSTATIGGGRATVISGQYDWAAGTLFEDD